MSGVPSGWSRCGSTSRRRRGQALAGGQPDPAPLARWPGRAHSGGMRTLAEIDADIAEVRSALSAARRATTWSADGASVSRNYAELRKELADLRAERRQAAGQGAVQFVPTYRRC